MSDIIGNLLGSDKSNMPFELRVALGMEEGMDIVDKFGSNPDVSTNSVPEDMWELGGVYGWGSDVGDEAYVSSSSGADTQLIEFTLLTVDGSGDWNEETFEQTIAGQVKTLLLPPSGDPVVRMKRMENNAPFGNDVVGTVYAYLDDTVAVGVPQTHSKILGAIVNGSNQTKQLLYTIPSKMWGFLWRGEAGTTKAAAAAEMDFAYRSRRIGQCFKEKKDFGVMTSGSNNYLDLRPFPDIIPAKTDLGIRVSNASGNNMAGWGTFHILLITDERYNKLRGN